MKHLLALLVLCFAAVAFGTVGTHVVKGRMLARPTLVRHGSKPEPSQEHEVLIAITMLNMAELESTLLELSDPMSPSYQQWWTGDRVVAAIDNPVGYEAVKQWLESNSVRIVWTSSTRHFVQASASLATWEQLLHAEFYTWRDTHPNSSARRNGRVGAQVAFGEADAVLLLSEHYSVPRELHEHIHAIFGTSQSPPIMTSRAVRRETMSEETTRAAPLDTQTQAQAQAETAEETAAATGEVEESSHRRLLPQANGVVDPPYLRQLYEIGSSFLGNSSQTQSVFAAEASKSLPYYSSKDLCTFLTKFGYPCKGPLKSYHCGSSSASCTTGDSFDTTQCNTSPTSPIICDEGNLDTQYITSIAQKTRSVFWVEDGPPVQANPFVGWAAHMVSDLAGPKAQNVHVTSISFGATEITVDHGSMDLFNNAAITLGMIGSTIVVSSGDNGAPGTGVGSGGCSQIMCIEDTSSSAPTNCPWRGSGSWSGVGYFPSFPATSPYVTAIGATMGPEMGLSERVCQSDVQYTGSVNPSTPVTGIITSGGGFSTYYQQPAYQKLSVAAYFKRVSGTVKAPKPGFNPLGRGYPDVSFIGVRYLAVIQGQSVSMFGTSAAAPLFASMISLVNALRAQHNKGPIGFINPTLYQVGNANKTFFNQYNISYHNASLFNDVTQGDNLCCSAGQTSDPSYAPVPLACCNSGFTAVKGWDPASGWGSMAFTKFAAVFSVTAPFIPEPPQPAASPEPASMKLSPIGVLLVLFIISLVVGGVYWSVVAARRAGACGGTAAPPVADAQTRTPQAGITQGPGGVIYVQAQYYGQGQGQGQAQGQGQGQGQVSYPSLALGPMGGSLPQPPQQNQRLSFALQHQPQQAIYGFTPDEQLRGSGYVGTVAQPPQSPAYSSWGTNTAQLPGTAGAELQPCPRCGRGFVDAVALVEHVSTCRGR